MFISKVDLNFTPINNGTEYSVSKGTSDIVGAFTIPSEYNGLSVTNIGAQAFINCASITKVTIPDTITRIEARAFASCRI